MLVILDEFTKMAHWIPSLTKVLAKDITNIFLKEIYKSYNVQRDIVADGETKITLHLWQVLLAVLGIETKLATVLQPETNSETERVNHTIEEYPCHDCW